MIIIDPQRCFGRPSIRGVPTEEIANRVAAGDSVVAVAIDFRMSPADVHEALTFEAGAEHERIKRAASPRVAKHIARRDVLLAALR